MKLARIVHSIASAMGGRLGTAAANFGLFWYLAQTADNETLGGFSLLMSVFSMLALLPLMGLSTPFMRRVAVSTDDLSVEVSNAFAFAAPMSALLMLSTGAWGQLSHHRELVSACWMVAASMLPTAWISVAECTLLARERIRDVTRVNLMEAVLRTGLSILLVRMGRGLDDVFAVFLAMRCLTAMVYAFHSRLPLPRIDQWSAALQRRNWREVPVYFGITLVAALVARLDMVMVSHLRDLRDAATYAAASRLYEASLMLPTVTALVVMPVLARQHVSAPETIPATLGLVVRLGLTIGLGAAVLASAFAWPVIALLYRPEMAGAAVVLACLAFAAAFMMVDVILSSTMIATVAQQDDLRALTVGLVALALLLLMLVPDHGPAGAALAVTAGLLVRVLMRLRWAVRALRLPPPWTNLAQLAVACTAGLGAMSALRPHGAWAAGLSGLLAYGLAATLTGALSRRFLRELRAGFALLAQRS